MKDDVIEDTGTDLITIPHKTDVPALFAKEGGIAALVARIEKEARAVVIDHSTAKGRKEVKSLAAKVSRSKTLIDEVGAEQNAERLALNKEVNALRNLAKERLDALRDEIKAPVEAWEAKEAERVRLHLLAMDAFDQARVDAHADSSTIQGVIDSIEATEIGEAWEEYEADARAAKAAALVKFSADLGIAKAREAQAAELEQLRAAAAKREQEDAERAAKEEAERAQKERAEREAQEKAEAEQRVKEAASRAAKEAEEKAARELAEAKEAHAKQIAESKAREEAAAQAERDRAAAEKRRADEAQAALAADKKHRQKVRAEIVSAITELKPANWEELVDAMIWGKIPHTKVTM